MLIYICDNEKEEINSLRACLLSAASSLDTGIRVAAFPSGEKLIEAVEAGGQPALAVLDIYMDGMDGIATARRLRELLPGLPVAFLTASREFAVEAFALDALHYIVKPVTDEDACTLLRRLAQRPGRPAASLRLPTRQGSTVTIAAGDIIRIISKSRGVEISLQGRGTVWFACQFWKVAEQLSADQDFLLLGRGCLVNLPCVERIDVDTCYLKDGECLPVSRRERITVKNRFNDFLFRQLDHLTGDNL